MSRKKKSNSHLGNDFCGIPRKVMRCLDYRKLNGSAVKLLHALNYQFTGENNGDLTAALSVMKKQHGFSSKGTVWRALDALIAAGMIIKTWKGGLPNDCNLFALTWIRIHPCNGKLSVQPTANPPRQSWNMEQAGVDAVTYKHNRDRKSFDWHHKQQTLVSKRDHTGLKTVPAEKAQVSKRDQHP